MVLTAAYAVAGRWRERYDETDHRRSNGPAGRVRGRPPGRPDLRHAERGGAQAGPAGPLPDDRPGAGAAGRAGRRPRPGRPGDPGPRPVRAGRGPAAAPVLVLVTHHVEEIPPGFTHALLLRAGRVVAAGPVDECSTWGYPDGDLRRAAGCRPDWEPVDGPAASGAVAGAMPGRPGTGADGGGHVRDAMWLVWLASRWSRDARGRHPRSRLAMVAGGARWPPGAAALGLPFGLQTLVFALSSAACSSRPAAAEAAMPLGANRPHQRGRPDRPPGAGADRGHRPLRHGEAGRGDLDGAQQPGRRAGSRFTVDVVAIDRRDRDGPGCRNGPGTLRTPRSE